MASTQDISRDAERWVEAHGDALYRYAYVRLREVGAAEDLVQETLLAAWKSKSTKPTRRVDSERAWLLGILRHKIADHYRRQARSGTACDPDTLASLEAAQFSAHGWFGCHWLSSTGPRGWSQTTESLQRREFWHVFHQCADRLPKQAAQVFLLRELDDCATEEIGSLLGLSSSNVFVILHRSRLALRRCLELNWFGRKKPRTKAT